MFCGCFLLLCITEYFWYVLKGLTLLVFKVNLNFFEIAEEIAKQQISHYKRFLDFLIMIKGFNHEIPKVCRKIDFKFVIKRYLFEIRVYHDFAISWSINLRNFQITKLVRIKIKCVCIFYVFCITNYDQKVITYKITF